MSEKAGLFRRQAVLVIVMLLLLAPILMLPAFAATTPPRMRPYAGIGVLVLAIGSGTEDEQPEPFRLYQEPAIARIGDLKVSGVPPYEWIFGVNSQTVPLIVTARKGNWLRVNYDDAGREAWLSQGRRGAFQPWDLFLKRQSAHLLPGLQKKFYGLFQQPGTGTLATLTPKQFFRVLRLDNDWAMVVLDQSTLGWLRWRDEDGRLLLGLERTVSNQK